MKYMPFDTSAAWPVAFSLTAHLSAGIVLGLLYFNAVWLSAQMFGRGAQVHVSVALITGRVILLGGLLTLVSREGAGPLLAMALGILIARPFVMRARRATAT